MLSHVGIRINDLSDTGNSNPYDMITISDWVQYRGKTGSGQRAKPSTPTQPIDARMEEEEMRKQKEEQKKETGSGPPTSEGGGCLQSTPIYSIYHPTLRVPITS